MADETPDNLDLVEIRKRINEIDERKDGPMRDEE